MELSLTKQDIEDILRKTDMIPKDYELISMTRSSGTIVKMRMLFEKIKGE